MDLSKYKRSDPTMKPNYILIPVNRFGFNESDINDFNLIYKYILENEDRFKKIVRTKSGGISIQRGNIRGPRLDITVLTSKVEITLKDLDGYWYRFQIGHGKAKEKETLSGRKCWIKFKDICEKFNIDINKFAISEEEGRKVKSEIESPKIDVRNIRRLNKEFDNCHHLDLNSSFMSGIANYQPELKPAIEYIYNNRKQPGKNEEYKAILTHTYGFMQCGLVNYRFSHLSKAAMAYNNRYIEDLAVKLENSGRRIIGFNTDGIWYQGEIYHDENEGNNLGQWKTDHTNCKLRYKSKGCYEFIEDGKYTPVFRGQSNYEFIKAKETWEWGDIYKGEVIEYKFDKKEGIIKYESKI